MRTHDAAFISWIGDTDMIDFYRSLSRDLQGQFIALFPPDRNKSNFIAKARGEPDSLQSPIKLIFKKHGSSIGEVHLITNRLATFFENKDCFAQFLLESCPPFKGTIKIHDCESQLTRITDLSGVYTVTQGIVSGIKSSCTEIYCNISSGVGVTSAALIMLSSAYFEKPHILQTYRSSVVEDPLPESFSSLILRRSVKTEENLPSERIIGSSDAIKRVLRTAYKVSPFDYSVLLLGPSGTGKSTLAREIHNLSNRKTGRFEYVNCGSLSDELLESELYGHRKGSFTGATADRAGVFKTGDKGTVFLDEIADCSLEMQASLLRVLQPDDIDRPTIRRFRPIGADKDETSDVRVLAATNKDLRKLVHDGRFREDLYYRLATSIIIIPGLSNRKEDIPILAKSILAQINKTNRSVPGFTLKHLTPNALDALQKHDWIGNVRELQNVLQQAAILSDAETIDTADLHLQREPFEAAAPEPELFSLDAILTDLQRRYISAALQTTGGNKAKASRLLGMKTPQNLESRIKALNIRLGT